MPRLIRAICVTKTNELIYEVHIIDRLDKNL